MKKNDIERLNLNGAIKSITETSYDIVSDEEETIFTQEESPSLITEILFNEQGNICEQHISMPENKNNSSKLVYKYNENNIKEEECWYNSDGSLYTKTICEHDENEFIITESVYYQGMLSTKWESFYDEVGNTIEYTGFHANGSNTQRELKYDDRGNKIEETWHTKDEFTSTERWTYTYDENDNMTKQIAYEQDGSVQMITTYRYSNYDSNGNWTKQEEFMDDIPIKTTIRTIQYLS